MFFTTEMSLGCNLKVFMMVCTEVGICVCQCGHAESMAKQHYYKLVSALQASAISTARKFLSRSKTFNMNSNI